MVVVVQPLAEAVEVLLLLLLPPVSPNPLSLLVSSVVGLLGLPPVVVVAPLLLPVVVVAPLPLPVVAPPLPGVEVAEVLTMGLEPLQEFLLKNRKAAEVPLAKPESQFPHHQYLSHNQQQYQRQYLRLHR